jgi:hypothetical protein
MDARGYIHERADRAWPRHAGGGGGGGDLYDVSMLRKSHFHIEFVFISAVVVAHMRCYSSFLRVNIKDQQINFAEWAYAAFNIRNTIYVHRPRKPQCAFRTASASYMVSGTAGRSSCTTTLASLLVARRACRSRSDDPCKRKEISNVTECYTTCSSMLFDAFRCESRSTHFQQLKASSHHQQDNMGKPLSPTPRPTCTRH